MNTYHLRRHMLEMGDNSRLAYSGEEFHVMRGTLEDCQEYLRHIMAERFVDLSVYTLYTGDNEFYQSLAIEPYGVMRLSPALRFKWVENSCT